MLASSWLRSLYPSAIPVRLVLTPPHTGMYARRKDNEIHACSSWLSDFSLCHELAHFLQPACTSGHGPEFAATLLRLPHHFRPATATRWLSQGLGLVGASVSTESHLDLARLAHGIAQTPPALLVRPDSLRPSPLPVNFVSPPRPQAQGFRKGTARSLPLHFPPEHPFSISPTTSCPFLCLPLPTK